MGEMVAPTSDNDDEDIETNSSDDEDGEVLSPAEREKLNLGTYGMSGSVGINGGGGASDSDDGGSEFSGQADLTKEEADDELVEMGMGRAKRRSRG
jgi:hypothetical protein